MVLAEGLFFLGLRLGFFFGMLDTIRLIHLPHVLGLLLSVKSAEVGLTVILVTAENAKAIFNVSELVTSLARYPWNLPYRIRFNLSGHAIKLMSKHRLCQYSTCWHCLYQ